MKKLLLPLIGLMITAEGLSQSKTTVSTGIPVLKTATDSLQYAVGAYLGAWLKNNSLEQLADQPLFKKGVHDRFKNTMLLNDSMIAKKIDLYSIKVAAENGRVQEQQLFTALRTNPNIGVLPGGVYYEIVTKGKGQLAGLTDSVMVNLKGQTTGGVLVVDTYRDKRPVILAINHLIKGLSDAVSTMPEGSKWKVYIPSALAYGKDGLSGMVAPNTALLFEVELLKIKAATVTQQESKK
jgi:FKBP-type peptidyl-prolyl cis-trans isomerase